SPYSFAIRKTNAEIEKDREDILKSVLPIYQNDADVVQNAIESLNSEFEIKWRTSGIPDEQKANYNEHAVSLLNEVYKRGLYDPVKKYQRYNPNYNFSLLTNNVSTIMSTADAFTLESATAYLKEAVQEKQDIENK